MKINWCCIGIHDYEQTECLTRAEIESDVTFGNKHTITYSGSTDAYCKKTCLRCGKTIDEVSPIYREFENKKKIAAQRQLKVRHILQQVRVVKAKATF